MSTLEFGWMSANSLIVYFEAGLLVLQLEALCNENAGADALMYNKLVVTRDRCGFFLSQLEPDLLRRNS